MKTKIKDFISLMLIISMVLPFALQTANAEIVLSDEIVAQTAETTVMAVCKPGYYITNTTIRMRNAPSLSGKQVSWIIGNKVINITSVEKDSEGYYWGLTTHQTSIGIFTGYVRLDNCTKYTLPTMTTDDIKGKTTVNWTVIDVSSYQMEDCIDWTSLKNSGVKGVILRIGGRGYGSAGTLYSDDAFLCHYLNARAAGLHIGCYFFSYALTEKKAIEEAEYTLNLMKQYGAEFDMPIFIDIEDADGDSSIKHHRAGKTVCTDVCNTFCSTIEKAGYYSGIYCNLDFAENLIDVSAFTNRGKWIAHYSSVCGCDNTDMWQYTPYGKINGFYSKDYYGNLKTDNNGNAVLGYLDVNHCYKNFPKLISNLKNTAETTTEETTVFIPVDVGATERTTTAVTTTQAESTSSVQSSTEAETAENTPQPSKQTRTEKTVVVTKPTCVSNGQSRYYLNGVYSGWTLTEKTHSDGIECILQNSKAVNVGDKLTEDDIKSAMSSDSSYFETALSTLKKNNGYTVSYCPDCLKVISINYCYASTSCQHKNTVSTEIKAATCTKDGIQQTKCAGCSEILSQSVIPKGHKKSTNILTSDVEKPYITKKCTVCSKTIYKKVLEIGDIDYTGTVSIKDARTILRMSIGLTEADDLSRKLGDSDADNVLTVTDARNALRKALKYE